MKKKLKDFWVGYFTDEAALELLRTPAGGAVRPAALHIEAKSFNWVLRTTQQKQGEALEFSNHADFCARLLAGATTQGATWNTGFIDECENSSRGAFMASALNPDVRVITISSQSSKVPSFSYRDYRNLGGPVVLKASGNSGEDWLGIRQTATLEGAVYMPGFVRVGEVLPSGEIYSSSQASGPAFVCDHPRNVKEVMGDQLYYPTVEDVRTFLDWPHHGIPKNFLAQMAAYAAPAEDLEEFGGTSGSAPHAGAMVMRHTANMKSITSYDIIPALLMATQTNEPPPWAKRRVETQSGMIFDTIHYGHGILIEECLSQALQDIWDIRTKSGKATQSGEYSKPLTVEGRGYMSALTERAQGPVVNTVLALSFLNDEADPDKTEARIPEYIMLRSPQGTLIHLPILFDRKDEYGQYVRAGYQTAAFFGEDISKGEWRIGYPSADINPLQIASMKIIAHTMHEKSPGNVLFKGFQKAARIERAQAQALPLPKPSI